MKNNNWFKHFKKICVHKFWVFYYCNKIGMTWRGLVHDLSKFSPAEFKESYNYYDGTKSPIDVARKEKGYSYAWIHHKSKNKHHYQYWIDKYDINGHPTYAIMPFKYASEMFCDYLAAGRAYMGNDFTIDKEIEWWENRCKTTYVPAYVQNFINLSFAMMKTDQLDRSNLALAYNTAINKTKPIVQSAIYDLCEVKKVPDEKI